MTKVLKFLKHYPSPKWNNAYGVIRNGKKEKGDGKMYGTVIEIKKDVTSDVLSQLKIVIENAFSNRVGTVKNVSKEPYHFEFTQEISS